VPAALNFLVSYGADVVEPMWSIERYLDFVLLLMVATALSFQLPVLQPSALQRAVRRRMAICCCTL
jgi:sec-independent protein translocase protein TatC